MSEPIKSHKQLKVWHKGMDIAVIAIGLADGLPACDQYGLAHQMRKAAISIPSIAEGFGRRSAADYARLLGYALTSTHELETQIELGIRTKRLEREQVADLLGLCDEVGRMLNTLIRRLVPQARRA